MDDYRREDCSPNCPPQTGTLPTTTMPISPNTRRWQKLSDKRKQALQKLENRGHKGIVLLCTEPEFDAFRKSRYASLLQQRQDQEGIDEKRAKDCTIRMAFWNRKLTPELTHTDMLFMKDYFVVQLTTVHKFESILRYVPWNIRVESPTPNAIHIPMGKFWRMPVLHNIMLDAIATEPILS